MNRNDYIAECKKHIEALQELTQKFNKEEGSSRAGLIAMITTLDDGACHTTGCVEGNGAAVGATIMQVFKAAPAPVRMALTDSILELIAGKAVNERKSRSKGN